VVSTYTYAVSSIHNKCPHPFKALSPSDHNHSKEHDTVSWGGFNLHICRLPIRNKHPLPPPNNPEKLFEVVSTHTYAVLLPLQSIPPLVVEEPGLLVVEIWQKHGVMTTTWNWVMQSNQLIEHQRFREQIPPSHTLGSIPSEHGAFALGKAAQSCATHGEANRWGSRIYGDTVSSSHVVPKPQSLSFAFTAHSPWTVCLWGGEQPTGWCWCNVVSSVILILYRQPRWLYTITQIVCQVQSETMIAHFEYELSGHSVGGCDRLCSRLRNRR